MNKSEITNKLKEALRYKAPEQLAAMMGFIGSINREGKAVIEDKWWPKNDYIVGLLKGGGNGVHRMAVLFPDKSFSTFG